MTAIKTLVIPALLTLIAFFITFQFVDPAPPNSIRITTGSEQGAYYKYAQRYKNYLMQFGINVEVEKSSGSVENLSKLGERKVDVAFIQGGIVKADDTNNLKSLGSLYYEPLWVFYRSDQVINSLLDIRGKRVYWGEEGSGTQALVSELLSQNQLQDTVTPVSIAEADVIFMVAAATSETVNQYLSDGSLNILSFDRAEAYQRRLRYLTFVSIPRGMIDLSRDLPAEDKVTLATTANLVINDDLHPAIQDLLLQAAAEVHSQAGWFESQYEFPNDQFPELPMSDEAKRYYKHGPPLLQKYLPFRIASLIDRLKVMLLPLILMLVPLMKIMPPIYTWRMRSKIYRWYQQLELIDLATDKADSDVNDLKQQLNEIEQEVIHVEVPLSFASQLYDLRQHIELVKKRIAQG